jgi:hypothetical protein
MDHALQDAQLAQTQVARLVRASRCAWGGVNRVPMTCLRMLAS